VPNLGSVRASKEILNTDGDLLCVECAKLITDDGYAFLGNDESYCEACGARLLLESEAEARVFADANCKITRPINRPDADRTCARHEHTNYDELVNSLDTTKELNALYWFAIRDQIDELVEQAIEEASGADWDAESCEHEDAETSVEG
jgi:hypothetical protein